MRQRDLNTAIQFVLILAVLIVVLLLAQYAFKSVFGDTWIRVNQTNCLMVDDGDRMYDAKENCYIRATQENIQDYCAISKNVEAEWCDSEIMTDLLKERINEK